jgi:MoaA/NifB/PqqE/SkfB family radical SAM enzyme
MDLDRFKRMMDLRRLYLKSVLPVPYPLILNIEPTNRCNLACTMCPRATSGRPLVDLAWPDAELLFAELKRFGPILKVFLQKDGEPLLYPRLVDLVAGLTAVRAARTIAIITNGTLLTEELFVALAHAGLHDLIVSIDADNPAAYLALKGVDRYETVVANVERALARKRREGWTYPLIKTRMVARRGHEAEVARFTHYWQGKADLVDITPFHTWIGTVADERCYSGATRYPCSLLWYTGVINADGRVSPCCIDFNEQGTLGSIRPAGFQPIWTGPALNGLRRRHLEGRYAQTAICGPCDYWLIKEDLGAWLRRKYRMPT